MKKFYDSIVDEAGNIMPGAEVYIRDNTTPYSLLTLYADSAGTTTTANPVTADSGGYITFWAADNLLKIEVYFDGDLVKTITDYQHFDATDCWVVPISDETTAITAGTNKFRFRIPYACTLLAVRGNLNVAQVSGNIFTVDVNESGTTVLSTKLTIANGALTSVGGTAPVISDTSLAEDAILAFDVDQIGSGEAAGAKVTLIVRRL